MGKMSKLKMVSVKRTTEPKKAPETPQMKAVRKKMLDRKRKLASNEKKKASGSGTAPKNKKKSPSSSVKKQGKNGRKFRGRHPKSRAAGETSNIANSSSFDLAVSSVAGERLDVSCAIFENTREWSATRRCDNKRLKNPKSGVSKNGNPKKNLAAKRMAALRKKPMEALESPQGGNTAATRRSPRRKIQQENHPSGSSQWIGNRSSEKK